MHGSSTQEPVSVENRVDEPQQLLYGAYDVLRRMRWTRLSPAREAVAPELEPMLLATALHSLSPVPPTSMPARQAVSGPHQSKLLAKAIVW